MGGYVSLHSKTTPDDYDVDSNGSMPVSPTPSSTSRSSNPIRRFTMQLDKSISNTISYTKRRAGMMLSRKSHFDQFTSQISGLPKNQKSKGRIKFIRLLKKNAFLKLSSISGFLDRVKKISAGIKFQCNRSDDSSSMASIGTIDDSSFLELEKLLSDCTDIKKDLEDTLIWTATQKDDCFELFPLEDSPPFTYVSHREGSPLGGTCELVIGMANAKEDYIWFDMCCIPNTFTRMEDSLYTVVLWNMEAYIEHATTMITYHGNDGICLVAHVDTPPCDGHQGIPEVVDVSEDNPSTIPTPKIADEAIVKQPPDVCGNDTAGSIGDQGELVEALPAPRVIRSLDDVSHGMLYTLSLLHSCESLPSYVTSELHCRNQSTSVTLWYEMERICNKNMLLSAPSVGTDDKVTTLKCNSSVDLETLTHILCEKKCLPAIFTESTLYSIETSSKRPSPVIIMPDHRRTVAGSDHGWVYVSSSESWVFQLYWPQNSTHEEISIHIHQKCLKGTRDRTAPVNVRGDMLHFHRNSQSYEDLPCVICRRNGWNCRECQYVNERTAIVCVICKAPKERPPSTHSTVEEIKDEDMGPVNLEVGVEVEVSNFLGAPRRKGVIVAVRDGDMFDVKFGDGEVEPYISEENIFPVLSRCRTDGPTPPQRVCAVCRSINGPKDLVCLMCQAHLIGGDDDDGCSYNALPIGKKVVVCDDEGVREGIVAAVHRFGMYDIDYSDGKKGSYIAEERVKDFDTLYKWQCDFCKHYTSNDSSVCSFCESDRDENADGVFKSQVLKMQMMGAKVDVKLGGGKIYYPGVITRVRRNGLYDVKCDNGETETHVKESNIAVIGIFCGNFD